MLSDFVTAKAQLSAPRAVLQNMQLTVSSPLVLLVRMYLVLLGALLCFLIAPHPGVADPQLLASYKSFPSSQVVLAGQKVAYTGDEQSYWLVEKGGTPRKLAPQSSVTWNDDSSYSSSDTHVAASSSWLVVMRSKAGCLKDTCDLNSFSIKARSALDSSDRLKPIPSLPKCDPRSDRFPADSASIDGDLLALIVCKTTYVVNLKTRSVTLVDPDPLSMGFRREDDHAIKVAGNYLTYRLTRDDGDKYSTRLVIYNLDTKQKVYTDWINSYPGSFDIQGDGKVIASTSMTCTGGNDLALIWFGFNDPTAHQIHIPTKEASDGKECHPYKIRLENDRAVTSRFIGKNSIEIISSNLDGQSIQTLATFKDSANLRAWDFKNGHLASVVIDSCSETSVYLQMTSYPEPFNQDALDCPVKVAKQQSRLDQGKKHLKIPFTCPNGCRASFKLYTRKNDVSIATKRVNITKGKATATFALNPYEVKQLTQLIKQHRSPYLKVTELSTDKRQTTGLTGLAV